jgi:hypothetical protein
MTFLETLRRQDRVVLWLAWIVDPDWILIDGPGGFFWRVDQLSGRMTAAVRPVWASERLVVPSVCSGGPESDMQASQEVQIRAYLSPSLSQKSDR